MKIFWGFIFFFSTAATWANCNHRLEVDPIVVHWSGELLEEQENVVIKSGMRTNGQCRRVYIGFGKGNENVYARMASHSEGGKISYNLYARSNGRDLLKDLPEASNNDVLSGSFHSNRPNQIMSRSFWIQLPENLQLPKAGVYRDRIRLNLYEHQLRADRQGAYVDLPIEFIIAEHISLSLLDEGRSFDANDTTHTMNFGTLTQGRTQRMDIRVRANLGHRLYFSSINNGQLKHVSASDKVSYDLTVSGRRVSLAGSAHQPALAGESMTASPETGELYQVGVQIGSVAVKRAGEYRDVITVSVEAI